MDYLPSTLLEKELDIPASLNHNQMKNQMYVIVRAPLSVTVLLRHGTSRTVVPLELSTSSCCECLNGVEMHLAVRNGKPEVVIISPTPLNFWQIAALQDSIEEILLAVSGVDQNKFDV